MSNLWLKIKIWTKVVLFGLLLVYLLMFITKNSENHATLWFWFSSGSAVQTSVLKLVLFTFLLGVAGTILVRTTFTTLRQMRELKERSRAERMERELTDMKAKAAMLRPRTAEPGPTAMGASDETP